LKSIFKAILATLIYIIGIELIASWIYIPIAFKNEDVLLYYMPIQAVLQSTAVFVFVYFATNRSFKNLIKNTHFKWYFFALILGIAFIFIQTPLNWVYNLLFGTNHGIIYDFNNWVNLKKLGFIVLIPIAEELFFRRYVQDNLQIKINAILAIILASILFASMHLLQIGTGLTLRLDWNLLFITFFGGLLSGVLYYKSKSVGPSIVFHIMWNLMAFII
jgi:membrane protease YdiL (CAAX protease family)